MTDTNEPYVYLNADRPLGKRINFYYERLSNAKLAGYGCLADWVKALHKEYKGNASHVAAKLGTTYKTVVKWFRNLGLPIKARGGKDPMHHPRRNEVGKIYQQTGSGIKTAKILGVSTAMVYRWLRADRKKEREERMSKHLTYPEEHREYTQECILKTTKTDYKTCPVHEIPYLYSCPDCTNGGYNDKD